MGLLVVDSGEVMLARQIHWLESLSGLADLRDVMGWCLGFVVLLVVRLLRENHFRRCRALVPVVLALLPANFRFLVRDATKQFLSNTDVWNQTQLGPMDSQFLL